jgi:adenylate kinase family enzyme
VIRRIQVMGSSGSGKSTAGQRLAAGLGVPFGELDALFWLPGWVERDTDDFRTRVAAATEGDRWVVSGNYTGRLDGALWERAEIVAWLDLPLHVTMPRQVTRSWRRWRNHELLWGTNYERFWPQLAVWDPNSLIGYSLRARPRFHRAMLDAMVDPRWAHVRFVRLTSQREVDRFVVAMIAEHAEGAA